MPEILDSLSLPGSSARPNEDSCGAAGRFAWVIDGYVLAGQPPLMDAPSDAAWLAAFASARFAARAPQAQDARDLIAAVIEEARAAFLARIEESGATARRDPATWPAAALTLAEFGPGRLVTYTLADTIAYVRDAEGAVYTLGEAPALRIEERALAERLMRETGTGCDAVRETDAFKTEMAARRRALVEGAPAAFGLHRDAAALAERGEVALSGEGHVLLASDGFSAYVELYERTDAEGLIAQALDEGLAEIGARLRAVEEVEDPQGRLHPRFKRSDDATAILLRATF